MGKFEYENNRITTALLLAAGTGSRLQPLTNDVPKCLAEVSGVSILERLTLCLRDHGFKRLIVVVGHMDSCIRRFLGNSINGLTIDYIFNHQYRTTNNIYSLWLARKMIHEPFLLVESDIVFDASLLENMLYPDSIAVSRILPWMSGTTVTVNRSRRVLALNLRQRVVTGESSYKTVNIYSLSMPSWHLVEKRLEEHISSGHVNDYYETVFAEMISEGSLSFKPVFFNARQWYEIDTIKDLQKSELIFSKKHNRLQTQQTGLI
ncbi:MAG TPA: phosphocholine cytidylyltransferase family protein [Nitrospirae bacterium]|nr:phosphocholine cytidylyltransferase family protein [Nitrospirota bacterium]